MESKEKLLRQYTAGAIKQGFVLLSLFVVLGGTLLQADNMILNGGFEVDSDGDSMADHWQFFGDNNVSARGERTEGFRGRFSQKLTCNRFQSLSPASHAMIAQLDAIRLEKGKWYRITFAAKHEGIPGGVVHVAISNTARWNNCGLQESFQATSNWTEYTFAFQATQTISNHTRLQFWYTSTGTLWLDEVSLIPGNPVIKHYTEVLSDTESTNLLPNSSFESGAAGWGSIAELPGWGGNLNDLIGEIDNTQAYLGTNSFKIALTPDTLPVFYFDYFPLYRVPVKAPLLGNRGWIDVSEGQSYTLSAYMKADCDDLVAVLSCRQAFRGIQKKIVRVTKEWKRYEFSFTPRASQVFIAFGPDLEASHLEKGTVWIDGVQLEKGRIATEYVPRSKIEVGLEMQEEGNLFAYGSRPEMPARVFNDTLVPQSLKLRIRTTDFDDKTVYEAYIPLTAAPNHTTKTIIP
ncbi:MAG: carbohydrate binding domain-containing protein, partial [Sedimentisphaerales bacterium]|nr:carbohydrate binding domain-containing protein [Sedimentisphaerales bacterium]